MSELTHEDIDALVADAKRLTKSIDRKFICQTLICAAADLLIEHATCRHMNCLQGNASSLHQLLDAHLRVAAFEKGFVGNKPSGLLEQIEDLMNDMETANTH